MSGNIFGGTADISSGLISRSEHASSNVRFNVRINKARQTASLKRRTLIAETMWCKVSWSGPGGDQSRTSVSLTRT